LPQSEYPAEPDYPEAGLKQPSSRRMTGQALGQRNIVLVQSTQARPGPPRQASFYEPAAGFLALTITGCSSRSSKVGDTLTRAESELEQSEASLKGIAGKPASEAINTLDTDHENHQRVLEELTSLATESFTQQEKERYQRVLARARERQAQIKEATAKVRAELKQQGKR
jgi:hypothetical protein